MKIVPIWVLMLIPLYLFVTNFFFVHWAREQTESVIRDPRVEGLTVEVFDGPNIFSAYTEAIYSFENRESMFIGVSKLCRRYTSLGWEDRSPSGCEEDVVNYAKLDMNTVRMKKYHEFCVSKDLRIIIYYIARSELNVYPWSVEVEVLAKRHTAMCK